MAVTPCEHGLKYSCPTHHQYSAAPAPTNYERAEASSDLAEYINRLQEAEWATLSGSEKAGVVSADQRRAVQMMHQLQAYGRG